MGYIILPEGIMRNISVNLFLIWTSGSGDVVLRYFLSRAHSVEWNHLGKELGQS